uniref:Transthyretin-like family protein n=1 Tax=Rhabditophanes sp. KR3021 TaxID=114890 RepID=A0AC35TR49_9BILA
MFFKLVLLLLVATVAKECLGAGIIGRTQSAGARGKFTCNGKPISGVLVKMYDVDTFDIDDLVASTKSDNSGYFSLSGSHKELTTLDITLNIYHKCNSRIGLCSKKFKINLPDRYVSTGTTVKNWYEAGTLELSGNFPGQSHDCIHK